MKRYIRCVLFVLLLLWLVPATKASADTGPKPSIDIKIEGIEGQPYYVTLLAKTEGNGPWSKDYRYDTSGPDDIWEKFQEYQDVDGYYFWSYFMECSKTNSFSWGYYPPDDFKILIYLPEKDCMICSKEIYSKYAFHTYFTVKVEEEDINNLESRGEPEEEWPSWGWGGIIYPTDDAGATDGPTPRKVMLSGNRITLTYDMGHEIESFAFRLAITVLIELAVAWFFSLRTKRQILVIIVTNVVTQGILNLLLNLVSLQKGATVFRLYYFALECFVFIIEALIYQKMFSRQQDGSITKKQAWLYALVANVCSFVIGLLLSVAIPSMF